MSYANRKTPRELVRVKTDPRSILYCSSKSLSARRFGTIHRERELHHLFPDQKLVGHSRYVYRVVTFEVPEYVATHTFHRSLRTARVYLKEQCRELPDVRR